MWRTSSPSSGSRPGRRPPRTPTATTWCSGSPAAPGAVPTYFAPSPRRARLVTPPDARAAPASRSWLMGSRERRPPAKEDRSMNPTMNETGHDGPRTVVVGGGQAGLSVGYHLARRGLPFVILDAHERIRSEEHTSELQSRENLVCR